MAVTSDSLRSIIRGILAEELWRLDGAKSPPMHPAPNAPGEQIVTITNDRELAAFVRELLRLASDEGTRREIEQGRRTFRLAGSPATPGSAATVRIESGAVTERQVEALPQGTTRLTVGKAVRLTPLARDRLRQRGITVERTG